MLLAEHTRDPIPPLDPERCYRALSARDARFDGVFFVGVTTTGIYCRPICPARRPAATRCRYFARAAEAERDGFRACLRCRPELAPGRASVDAQATLAATAVRRIEAGFLDEAGVDALADSLGVTARHLRRALVAELGVTPVELAQSRRLAVAKQLLQDTRLPLTEVAFASGFTSVRRFNAAFRERFGCPPSALRRPSERRANERESIRLRLDYRPPFAWDALLAFLRTRAIPGVEWVENDTYRRTVSLGGLDGWVAVRHGRANALSAELALPLVPRVVSVVRRLRRVFDLDAEPVAIAGHLASDPLLEPLVRRHPGLRVPGAFDGFETAVRAILGQQVSVAAATTLCGRLVARFGRPYAAGVGLTGLFPAPDALAAAATSDLAAIGLPARRAETISGLARAVAAGLTLAPEADAAPQLAALRALPGIGDWTADYIALRALHVPDAFPCGDLGLRKALGSVSAADAARLAERWRPWRSYAALHLWQALSQGG